MVDQRRERFADECPALLVPAEAALDVRPERVERAAGPDVVGEEGPDLGIGDELAAQVLVDVAVAGPARRVLDEDALHHGHPLDERLRHVVHQVPRRRAQATVMPRGAHVRTRDALRARHKARAPEIRRGQAPSFLAASRAAAAALALRAALLRLCGGGFPGWYRIGPGGNGPRSTPRLAPLSSAMRIGRMRWSTRIAYPARTPEM